MPTMSEMYHGLAVADNFKNRAREFLSGRRISARVGGRSEYVYVSGDYSQVMIADPDFNKPEIGLVDFFAERINRLLAENGVPFAVVDIGGMHGKTWAKLGWKYREAVKDGSVAFVVSSLHNETDGKGGYVPDYSADPNCNYLKSASRYVHFIAGDVQTLRRRKLKLPTGRELFLLKNSGVVFERYSLSYWGSVPEIEIPMAVSLLSDSGIYVVSPDNHAVAPRETVKGRAKGIAVGRVNAFYNQGLIGIPHIEGGSSYGRPVSRMVNVYRKETASPIVFNV